MHNIQPTAILNIIAAFFCAGSSLQALADRHLYPTNVENQMVSHIFALSYESTYGEIRWREGWYGTPNNTIAVEQVVQLDAGWLVRGRWGRGNDVNKHGGFEFRFADACRFQGVWWYSGRDGQSAWEGWCRDIEPNL